MKKILFLLTIMAIGFNSCSNSERPEISPEKIIGKWHACSNTIVTGVITHEITKTEIIPKYINEPQKGKYTIEENNGNYYLNVNTKKVLSGETFDDIVKYKIELLTDELMVLWDSEKKFPESSTLIFIKEESYLKNTASIVGKWNLGVLSSEEMDNKSKLDFWEYTEKELIYYDVDTYEKHENPYKLENNELKSVSHYADGEEVLHKESILFMNEKYMIKYDYNEKLYKGDCSIYTRK